MTKSTESFLFNSNYLYIMNEIPIETDELGITIMKKQIDYLDDCEQKFKKKFKITKSKKKRYC